MSLRGSGVRQKKKRGVGEERDGYLVRVRRNKRVEGRLGGGSITHGEKRGELGERKDGRKRQKERLRG